LNRQLDREMSRVGSEGISCPLNVFAWRSQASKAVPKARGLSCLVRESHVDLFRIAAIDYD